MIKIKSNSTTLAKSDYLLKKQTQEKQEDLLCGR